MAPKPKGKIRVGVGGWTYEPWRGPFYPDGLPHKKELEFAASQLTSIEVNGTYYGSQKPESFARWREETPEGFVFSVKGPRFTTNRRVLAEAGASIERFVTGGVTMLREKLGPINWQFLPTKQFDAADFEAFLKLLPREADGLMLRHVVEVRHASFRTSDFVALLRAYDVATVLTDSETFPQIPDLTASFVYARLQTASEDQAAGYPPEVLAAWAHRAGTWAKGSAPGDMDMVTQSDQSPARPRDVFVYMINGFKPKAPAAALALIERLKQA